MTLRTAILILNWNGWDDSFACLDALVAIQPPADIFLIDNGSSQDRSDEVSARFAGVKVVRLGENYGWAGGYNRALDQARAAGFEAAYLLNNDTAPAPGFLAPLQRLLASDPKVAAIGSVILFPDGSAEFDGEFRPRGERPPPELFAQPVQVRQLHGAGIILSLAAFSQLGGFDERFFCYEEETEWCHRAQSAGYRLMLAPASRIVHAGESSDVNGNAAYYRTRNRFLGRRLGSQTASRSKLAKLAHQEIQRLKASGRQEAARAMFEGLADGLTGRFGKRPPPPSAWRRLAARAFIWQAALRS